MTEPRRQPDLGDRRKVEVVLVVLGIAQWRGLGVDCFGVLADIGSLENAESFGVSSHHAVLDSVVHHLDEMTGAVGSAVK